jgi:uncharacterized damage-inducible protein DinB
MQVFRAMAENNAWSNHRLLTVVEALGDEAFRAKRTGFFPSLHATLNHILSVDLYYLDALTGGGVGLQVFEEFHEADNAASLHQRQARSDARLIGFCRALREEHLSATVTTDRGEDGPVAERTDALLLHLFTHQTHHRGQAHAMLSETELAPPQLDEFFLAFDADRRQAEVRALGLQAL